MKKILEGLLLGTGFSIACIVCYSLWIQFIWPIQTKSLAEKVTSELNKSVDVSTFKVEDYRSISEPPGITEKPEFLGHLGSYSGDFNNSGASILAVGNSKIVGRAYASNKPVKGVRVRLALNGSAYSQWATTNDQGVYQISVPEGEYRIDGFEIDKKIADIILPGKIFKPNNSFTGSTMKVTSSRQGSGIDFYFVDPIIIKDFSDEYSLASDLEIRWVKYPFADSYTIQLYETESRHGYKGYKSVFSWQNAPKTSNNYIDLKSVGANLKAGKYYSLKIIAEDASGEPIAELPTTRGEVKFLLNP